MADQSEPDHATGPADDRRVLPDQLPGRMERLPRPEHLLAVTDQADAAGGAESISRRLHESVRRLFGRHTVGDYSTGGSVLRASARVHRGADQRGIETMKTIDSLLLVVVLALASAASLAAAAGDKTVHFDVDATQQGHAISPFIYGV